MSNSENLIFNSDNNHYYQITDTDHQSWTDAVAEANELGGYLVSIDDANELNLVQQNLNNSENYWIGGADNNVFAAATGDTYIASPTDDLSLPAVIEYDSIPNFLSVSTYATTAPTDDIADISFTTNLTNISTSSLIGVTSADAESESSLINLDEITSLLPSELQYLWDTVSIEETAENQYELSWQDSINLTALFGASDFLPDVEVENPTFTITKADSGNSYGFAGNISVGDQNFNIDTSFTLEEVNGASNFSWDNIAKIGRAHV